VLGVFIFGGNDKKYFGNLGKGMITLFRVMTLDHWGEVPTHEASPQAVTQSSRGR
jgi:hypothetical protein